MLTLTDQSIEPAWATLCPGSLVRADLGPSISTAPWARVMAWSGSLGESDFEPHPFTWGPRGWERLEQACEAILPGLASRGKSLCLRPHHAHVLSDVSACLRFFEARRGQPFRLILDPLAMLAPSMRSPRDAEHHLSRILGALARHRATEAVLIAPSEPGDEALAALPVWDSLDPSIPVIRRAKG